MWHHHLTVFVCCTKEGVENIALFIISISFKCLYDQYKINLSEYRLWFLIVPRAMFLNLKCVVT